MADSSTNGSSKVPPPPAGKRRRAPATGQAQAKRQEWGRTFGGVAAAHAAQRRQEAESS